MNALPLTRGARNAFIVQAWAGHSGSPFKTADRTVSLPPVYSDRAAAEAAAAASVSGGSGGMFAEGSDAAFLPVSTPAWQYLYKPLSSSEAKVAVLLMNHDSAAQVLTLDFADVPGLLPTDGRQELPCPFTCFLLSLSLFLSFSPSLALHSPPSLLLCCLCVDSLCDHAGSAPSVVVRDVWARADLGTFQGSFTTTALAAHDAAFLVLTLA
jgi:hypothetical protein